jgi:hypothetical protein
MSNNFESSCCYLVVFLDGSDCFEDDSDCFEDDSDCFEDDSDCFEDGSDCFEDDSDCFDDDSDCFELDERLAESVDSGDFVDSDCFEVSDFFGEEDRFADSLKSVCFVDLLELDSDFALRDDSTDAAAIGVFELLFAAEPESQEGVEQEDLPDSDSESDLPISGKYGWH